MATTWGDATYFLGFHRLFLVEPTRHANPRSRDNSLVKLRAELADETMDLWPGHAYGAERTTVAEEKRGGFLQPGLTRERWHAMMGS